MKKAFRRFFNPYGGARLTLLDLDRSQLTKAIYI
jgi:hypothetical protein